MTPKTAAANKLNSLERLKSAMVLDDIFDKIGFFWSDRFRSMRVFLGLILFVIWLLLFCAWLLELMGYIMFLPLFAIICFKYITLFLLISAKVFFVSAAYLKDIYEIPRMRYALKYLLAVVFGFGIPKLKIVGGEQDFKGDFNSIESIGGPGILQISRDNVVAIETLQVQKNILMAGERPVSRFDFVREIVSTEEQYGKIDKMETLTADGIQVVVLNVQYRFRIDGHSKKIDMEFQAKDHIPSKKAVINLVYNRPVDSQGNPPPWIDTVRGTITSVIREYVNDAYLDELITPQGMDGSRSLDELRYKFTLPSTHARFKGQGVKLISCNIGEIAVASMDIDKERLKAWFVKQSGVIKVIRAQGDAESFASHERGRAEGQALLVKSIAHALQDVSMGTNDRSSLRNNLRKILLTRTAQILESRTSVYHTHKEEDGHDAHEGKM